MGITLAYNHEQRCIYRIEKDLQLKKIGIYIPEDDQLSIKVLCCYEDMLYAVCGTTNTLYAFDLKSCKLRYRVSTVGKSPVGIAAKGQHLFICCQDTDTLHKAERKNGQPVLSVHTGNLLTDMALSKAHCVVCSEESQEVKLFDMDELRELKAVSVDFRPLKLLYDEQTGNLYVCGRDASQKGRILLLDEYLHTIQETETGAHPVQMSCCGRNLAVFCTESEVIALYDKNTLKSRSWVKTPPNTIGFFAEDETEQAYIITDDSIFTWDMRGNFQTKKSSASFEGSGIIQLNTLVI